jgi:hypothetical protein
MMDVIWKKQRKWTPSGFATSPKYDEMNIFVAGFCRRIWGRQEGVGIR